MTQNTGPFCQWSDCRPLARQKSKSHSDLKTETDKKHSQALRKSEAMEKRRGMRVLYPPGESPIERLPTEIFGE
jgi:hypothetical protein